VPLSLVDYVTVSTPDGVLSRQWILAGSEAERKNFILNQWPEDGVCVVLASGGAGIFSLPRRAPISSFQGHDTMHLVGTCRLKPTFAALWNDIVKSCATIVDHTRPLGIVYAPTLGIAHVFAPRLGISEKWRYRQEE
jgi:hypothetical protein